MSRELLLLWLSSFFLIAHTQPCIPVLGFGVMKDSNNFTQRLISHIDFCVENFVLVLSCGDGDPSLVHTSLSSPSFKDQVLTWVNHEHIRNVTFIDVPHALIGVAETWNLILTSFQALWYVICAYDITFRPGQLREFSQRFWTESGLLPSKNTVTVSGMQAYTSILAYSNNQSNSRDINISADAINFAHTKWVNLPGNRGFNFFALTQEVISAVGLFDENIFPAFWEDRDYQYRLRLWPEARVKTFRSIRLWHGVDEPGSGGYSEMYGPNENNSGHVQSRSVSGNRSTSLESPQQGLRGRRFNYTSGTVYLGRQWVRTMQRASPLSMDYLMLKWGCNRTLTEQFHHLMSCEHVYPFGNGDHWLGYWQLNDSNVRGIREYYQTMKIDDSEGEADSIATKQFRDSLSASLSSPPPPKRKKSKYSFEDVKKFHHSRKRKVILAHNGNSNRKQKAGRTAG